MNTPAIDLCAERLVPLPSGALWWPSERAIAVADLHLGKSERMARRGGGMLPPYETRDTLDRLAAVIAEHDPRGVVSVGDCFDDLDAADAVRDEVLERLRSMAAGRHWVWLTGNHDPGPPDLPGSHRSELALGPLTFRHIARPGATGEISGHYHPKLRFFARGSYVTRPCFLGDADRVILPAFGTYTGGMDATHPVFDRLLAPRACAWLTGRRVVALPRPTLARA